MGFLVDLEIGWLNGWIYSAILVLVSCSCYLFAKRMTDFSWMSRRQSLIAGSADLVIVGVCIFTLWTPIAYPGILFWVGNLLYLLGLIVVALSIIAFAKTPEDQRVTRGIYRLVRHPYYVGSYLALIAIGLICKEWFILVLSIASMVPGYLSARWEEQHCQATYGTP